MTENDFQFPRRRALMRQRRAIVRICERRRTSALEEVGVACRLACLWAVVVVPAAKLVLPEGVAGALAPYHPTVRRSQLQRVRARLQQIRLTSHHRALPFPLVGGHRHRNVESVDQAHGVRGKVGVAVVEAELGQCGGGGAAEAVALQAAAAVTGDAGEVAVGVGAVAAGPYTAGPVGVGGGEGAVGEGVENEAAALQHRMAGVGQNGGPNGEGTVVDDC